MCLMFALSCIVMQSAKVIFERTIKVFIEFECVYIKEWIKIFQIFSS